MSYLLSGLDLVVNNKIINVVSTVPTIVNGDITPSEKIVAVGNAYNRFTNPDNTPVATIKSTNTGASLTGLTAKAINTTSIPIATSFNNTLRGTLNLNYDGEYYVKLLLGTASTSATISDSSNNAYTVVSSNVTANALNPFGSGSTYNSILFNGTSSYLTINNSLSSFLGSEDFTIEFFINPTNFTGGPVIIDTGTNLGFQYWQVSLTATGNVQFIYTYGTNTTVTVATTSTLTAATWSHVAIVRNNTVQTPGNNFNIYINGVSGVSALIANKYGDTGTIASSISIGKKLNNTLYFNGYLSNLRITQAGVYIGAFTKPTATLGVIQLAGVNIALIPAGRKLNTKLSTTSSTAASYEAAQINLYNTLNYNTQINKTNVYDPDVSGNFTVNSALSPVSNKNILSRLLSLNVGLSPEFAINGSDSPDVSESYGLIANVATSGYYGYFDPAATNTSISSINSGFNVGTGDFTAECWVWLDPSSNVNASFLATVTTGLPGFMIARDFVGLVPANGSGQGDSVSWTIPTSVWSHVALTMKSGIITAWLNGVLAGSLTRVNVTPSSTTLSIGRRYADFASYPFYGYISNVRLVVGTAVYTSNFIVPTSPLTATQSANANIGAITSSQTKLLTLQNSTIVDNSGFNNSMANNSTPLINMTRYSYPVELMPSNFITTSVITNTGTRYVSTPSVNQTLVEYVTNATDPRLVNKQVKNLIVGTTGVLEELQSWS